jgi:hypothetical protein
LLRACLLCPKPRAALLSSCQAPCQELRLLLHRERRHLLLLLPACLYPAAPHVPPPSQRQQCCSGRDSRQDIAVRALKTHTDPVTAQSSTPLLDRTPAIHEAACAPTHQQPTQQQDAFESASGPALAAVTAGMMLKPFNVRCQILSTGHSVRRAVQCVKTTACMRSLA